MGHRASTALGRRTSDSHHVGRWVRSNPSYHETSYSGTTERNSTRRKDLWRHQVRARPVTGVRFHRSLERVPGWPNYSRVIWGAHGSAQNPHVAFDMRIRSARQEGAFLRSKTARPCPGTCPSRVGPGSIRAKDRTTPNGALCWARGPGRNEAGSGAAEGLCRLGPATRLCVIKWDICSTVTDRNNAARNYRFGYFYRIPCGGRRG